MLEAFEGSSTSLQTSQMTVVLSADCEEGVELVGAFGSLFGLIFSVSKLTSRRRKRAEKHKVC
jgi:hypothetical protein